MKHYRALLARIVSVVVGVTAAALPAMGRQIAYAGKSVAISVPIGAPVLVRFEKAVKTVTNVADFAIHPASEDSPDYTTLMIEARSAKASGLVNFILSDGTIVRAKLVAISGRGGVDSADNVYDIKMVDAGTDLAGLDAKEAPEVKAIDLMKAMIRGDKVMGYDVRDVKKTLHTGTAGVSAELVRVYSGGDFNGYVFRIESEARNKAYQIDIRRLRLGEPNLAVLSQIDRKTLSHDKGGSPETYLRIVARPGSLYRDVVLPVTVLKDGKGERHGD